MPVSLSIKKVPDEVAELLRKRAQRHHRSLQGELLSILEAAVLERPLSADEVFEQIKKLRYRTPRQATRMIRELRDGR
jgi:plasmid stability protein